MKLPVLVIMSLTAVTLCAIPAKQGQQIDALQPDGCTVQLYVTGDEHHPLYMTSDEMPVIGTNQGYFYAVIGENGSAVCSSALAHNAAERSAAEQQLVSGIDRNAVMQAANTGRPHRQNITHSGIGSYNPDFKTIGPCHSLVFLVQYADVPFTIDDPYDYFNRMLNEEGFSLYNGTGSCRDYFIDSSNGLFDPVFDVYGPVTLPRERKYYGGNDDNGWDNAPQYMMLHAAQALDDTVDFSQYDLDGDGYVDNVFIFYAGRGESSGGGADTVWPHSMSYSFNLSFDGVRFRNYACSCELKSSWMPDGMGAFCHEFCHVLGLPDEYNTDDPNAKYTPCTWSVLDQGCYNNDSRTPPALSAFERNALGWMGDLLYEPSVSGRYTLSALCNGGEALLLPTEDQNEFFVIENRQLQGWDRYLPHHGMLVWHIDYNKREWVNNTPNNKEDHQRIDLIEACGRIYSSKSGQRRYPFPGDNGVTSLCYGGSPSLEDWQGRDIGYRLTDIREADGTISFDLSGDAGLRGVTADNSKSWTLTGRRLSAHGSHVTVSDISGRTVASGSDISVDIVNPGVYIITVDGTSSKMIVN